MKKIFIAGVFILFTAIALAQNVGIGKTNPQAKLEIKQTSNLQPSLMLSDSTGASAGQLRFRSLFSQYANRSWYTDYKVGIYSKDNEIFLYNDSTNVMNIYGTGNITIGDAVAPDARLTISSDNPSSDILNIMGASEQPALKITGNRNVGIGTPTPVQKLDVDGAIKIGTTATNQPGAIRYNAGKFEGGDGTIWKSFEGLPSRAIILASNIDTADIKLAGFKVLRISNLNDIYDDTTYTNNPGEWLPFPVSNPGDEPLGIYSTESVQYNNKLIYYNYNFDNATGLLYQYDITSQVWSQLPGTSPLSYRIGYSMTLSGNEIFIFGGYLSSPFTPYNSCAKYNLTTNTWSAVSNMPVASFLHSSCTLGSEIFVIGGVSGFVGGIQLERKMYKYNTLTNNWSADLSNSNTPFLTQGNALVRNNNLLLVRDSVTEYNPVLNTYIKLADIVHTNFYFVSCLVQDKINVFGRIDSTSINGNMPVLLHYQVNLLNGQSNNLSTCNETYEGQYISYQYINSLNKYYLKIGTSVGRVFNPSVLATCTIITTVVHEFLYYMKKL